MYQSKKYKYGQILENIIDMILLVMYCKRAIITRGLYILNTLFEGQKRFFKEVFSQNSALMYG